MPNGNCLKCGKQIPQGLTPHYCEECLAELGLNYDDHGQTRLDELIHERNPKMAPLQVRIFPHSTKEFPSEDNLVAWLLTGLRGRGGVYRLRNADSVKDVPPGSVVLFRYANRIVGEAVVWKGKETFPTKVKDRTLTGEEAEYGAQVTFVPSSIRLYAPPVPVERLQPHLDKDLVVYAGAYTDLEWSFYGIVLKEVVTTGTFIT
jgi:hypothetical protein